MSATADLERSILAAEAAGDQAKLLKLQARYRKDATVIRVTHEPVRLVERSSPAPTEPASDMAPPVDTSTSRPATVPTAVRLRPEAHQAIVNMPFESGMEVGGLLVGRFAGGEIVIETVYGRKGGDFVGERERLVLDGTWFAVIDEKARRGGWQIVGDVHSHKSAPEPSTGDTKGWRGMADGLKQHYAGIVVGPDPTKTWEVDGDLFERPELRAFIAVKGDRTVRPIALIIEEEVY